MNEPTTYSLGHLREYEYDVKSSCWTQLYFFSGQMLAPSQGCASPQAAEEIFWPCERLRTASSHCWPSVNGVSAPHLGLSLKALRSQSERKGYGGVWDKFSLVGRVAPGLGNEGAFNVCMLENGHPPPKAPFPPPRDSQCATTAKLT